MRLLLKKYKIFKVTEQKEKEPTSYERSDNKFTPSSDVMLAEGPLSRSISEVRLPLYPLLN
jgi:hypothetical protein